MSGAQVPTTGTPAVKSSWSLYPGPILTVMLFGIVGAFFSFILDFAEPIQLDPIWRTFGGATESVVWPIGQFGVGGLAALIFVYIFANTDTEDRGRLIAIALIAGVFWKPVVDSGRLFISAKVGGEKVVETAARDLEQATSLVPLSPGDPITSTTEATAERAANVKLMLERLQGTRGLLLPSQAAKLDQTVVDWASRLPPAVAQAVAPEIQDAVKPEIWRSIILRTPSLDSPAVIAPGAGEFLPSAPAVNE